MRKIFLLVAMFTLISCAGDYEGRHVADNFNTDPINIAVKVIENVGNPGGLSPNYLRVIILNRTNFYVKAKYEVKLGDKVKDSGTVTIPATNVETVLVAAGQSAIDHGQVKVTSEYGVSTVIW